MLDILRGEGWDLKERELTKLRKEQNLLLREPNKNGNGQGNGKKRKRKDVLNELGEQNGQQIDDIGNTEPAGIQPALSTNLAPEIIAKRQARQARLLAESEERLKSGTRRRRTKVWSGLPPDPVAPPRYPSELTMEECKKELGLDKQLYQEMRDTFEGICRANNVVKKTLCGADTWRDVKNELISRMPHLQSIFWNSNSATVNQTQQPMALELVCMDVTKKIRTVGTRVTISEAKNFLGLTPQEGRDLRSAFDTILKEDYFISKLEVPREHWEGLKARWIEGSLLLQQKLAGGPADPAYATKLKCLESIAADVQKRHRDQQTKNDPTHLTKSLDPARSTSTSISMAAIAPSSPTQQGTSHAPVNHVAAPLPANESIRSPPANINYENSQRHGDGGDNTAVSTLSEGMTTLASQALASASNPSYISYDSPQNIQIDPSLLEAASIPQDHTPHSNPQPTQMTTTSSFPPLPVYFRISPLSSPQHLASHPKVWLSTFSHPYTISSLKELALSKVTPGQQQAAKVVKIEGVAATSGNADSDGGEGGTRWSIDDDDELEAYLEMVRGGKATFIVEIA